MRHGLTRLSMLMALITGCSSHVEGGQEYRIWTNASVGIDFKLLNPIGQELCSFSATRNQLSRDQLDGLSSLMLEDGVGGAGCDISTYWLTVHAQEGSSGYRATHVECETMHVLQFEEFDAWATSTGCSLQAINSKP